MLVELIACGYSNVNVDGVIMKGCSVHKVFLNVLTCLCSIVKEETRSVITF